MAFTIDNVSSQMRKGFLEYCIMLQIARNPSYAPDIIKELSKAKLIVVEGTVYPLLTRLKNSGLLDYEWAESQQGPPRKYYKLTNDGAEALAELDKVWAELKETVNILHSNDSSNENMEMKFVEVKK